MSDHAATVQPAPVEVAPGIFLIRVPLPDNALKWLNSYLIMDDERPLLIDVGFNRVECEDALRDGLAACGLTFADVDVLVTHTHPDHTGCLDRIWREGMKVYGHFHSFAEVRTLNDLPKRTFLPIVDVVIAEAAVQRRPERRFDADLAPVRGDYPISYLREGDVLERGRYRFEVIETPGHNLAHICLYDRASRLMVTGDHVLEHITPNISSFFLETDDLGDFLTSLEKVRAYDVSLSLPGHGEPFAGVSRRAEELRAHHFARLAEMEELVRAGHHDIIDITANASWKYPNWYGWSVAQKFFSIGETMAHLVHAVHQGVLRMTIEGEVVEFEVASADRPAS